MISRLLLLSRFNRVLQKKCEKCQINMRECDICIEDICTVCNNDTHTVCSDCESEPTCHTAGICALCIDRHPYHYITETVAVGNRHTSYESFDIIFNLNYPDNGVEFGGVKLFKRSGKFIFHFGMVDANHDEYKPFAREVFDAILDLVTKLKTRFVGRQPHILFHCYAGISRSATAAAYFLARELGVTGGEALEMIRTKRKLADPNRAFRAILTESEECEECEECQEHTNTVEPIQDDDQTVEGLL